MDKDTAIQIFSKGLDGLLGFENESYIQLSWFLEDFDYFKEDFVNLIFARIDNPPFIEKIKSSQPIVPMICLLSYIMVVPTINKQEILNRIPDAVRSIIKHNDTDANLLLRKLIDQWVRQNYLDPETYLRIKEAFDSQINVPWNKPEEIIKEEQAYPEEIIEEEPEDKVPKFRPWMLNASMWDRGNSEDLSGIVFSEAPKAERTRTIIRVTPENENETCSVCSGKFKTENSKYGLIFVGVEKIKGSGYVHTSCKSHIKGFLV